MNHLQNVQFHGQAVPVFTQNNQHYAAMKPICENIGIDWEAQRQKIQRNQILNSTACMIKAVAPDGKNREMLCLPIEYLNGWLFGVDARRVKPEIRENLLRYQRECFQVLNAHFHPQRPALPTPASKEANREMFGIIAAMENALSKAHCGGLEEQIRVLTGKRCFDLDFYQLSGVIRKLIAGLPKLIVEHHPEVCRLRSEARYNPARTALTQGNTPPTAAVQSAAQMGAHYWAEWIHSETQESGLLSAVSARLLDLPLQEQEQAQNSANFEISTLHSVIIRAWENQRYNNENQNISAVDMDIALIEIGKLHNFVSALLQ